MGADWITALRRLRNHLFEREAGPLRAPLLAHCLRLTGERAAAEDLQQETLLRAMPLAGSLCGAPANLKAYLFKIATNLWIDQTRRRRRERTLLTAENPRHASEPALSATLADGLAHLERTLPARELEVFLLREARGLSSAETASRLGISEAAVKMAACRARKRLRGAAD